MTEFDSITKKILQALTADGRISNIDLAERVGLSPSACLRRVQELERSGVIRGYRAVLDAEQTGRGFVVYVAVGITEHTKTAQTAFEVAMQSASAVVECHNIAGAFEYLLRVEVEDLNAYKRFHTDVLGTFPQLGSITSHIVMDSTKDRLG